MLSKMFCVFFNQGTSTLTRYSVSYKVVLKLLKLLKVLVVVYVQVDRLVNTSDVLTVPHKAVKTASIVKQY